MDEALMLRPVERKLVRGLAWTCLAALAWALVARGVGLPAPRGPWTSAFRQWDAENYALVAGDGYPTVGPKAFTIVLPPLYPMLVRAGALFLPNLDASALLISNLAFLAAAVLLYRLARLERGRLAARRAVWLLALFPTAYFLHLGYTESVFLAFALAAFLAARSRRWGWAAAMGFLAAATRVNGFLVAPALAVEAFQQEGRQAPRRAWPLALAPLGLLIQVANCWLVYGNALVFFDIQRTKFGKQLAFPWVGFWGCLSSLSWRPLYDKVMVSWLEAVAGVALWAFAAWSWRRQRPAYAVYTTLTVAQFTFLNFWCSLPRYALCVFPLFLALADEIEDPRLARLALWAGACLQAAGLGLFAVGRWAF